MKIFDIIYSNEYMDGSAIVAACNAKEAATILQSNGRLNSHIYKTHSIREIGVNNNNIKQIISETFYKPRIEEKVTEVKVFERDIQNDTLYVDRIGSIKLDSGADNGYTVFNTYPRYTYGGVDRDKTFGVPSLYHLYIRRDNKFIDLGVPKVRNIKSNTRAITLSPIEFIGKGIGTTIIQKDESLKHRRYGIFIRRKKAWKFIKEAFPYNIEKQLKDIFLDLVKNRPNYRSGKFIAAGKETVKYVLGFGEMKKGKGYTKISEELPIYKRFYRCKNGIPTIIKEYRYILNTII